MRSVLIKQSQIKENEDKYRLLVEASPSYCEVFGKTEDELIGHQFLPLVHEDDRELTNRSLESLKLPPHQSYHEQRAMTKEGLALARLVQSRHSR